MKALCSNKSPRLLKERAGWDLYKKSKISKIISRIETLTRMNSVTSTDQSLSVEGDFFHYIDCHKKQYSAFYLKKQ